MSTRRTNMGIHRWCWLLDHMGIVELLKQNGINVNSKGEFGHTHEITDDMGSHQHELEARL